MKLETLLYYKDRGIEKIEVRYSGGGDSGAIDEYVFHDKHGKSINSEPTADLEDYCYKITNIIEDWWNNEGGHGQINIDLIDNSYEIINNIEHREYETYTHEGTLIDD